MRLIFVGFFSLLLTAGAFGQTITGVVVDPQGSPLGNAIVSLSNPGIPTIRTKTDSEGRFSLSGTITDRAILEVQTNGFAPSRRTLSDEAVQDFTIVLEPSGVTADVTVSITGTETRLNETPASVVALSREDLTSQTIDDSLRQIAGFTLFRRTSSRTANPTTHGANLRGVSGSGASRAAVLFDGLSINDAFGGWTYWSRVPKIAVDRVEVLRGGASSLYGTGGLSGAVNLVRRELHDDEALLRAEASAGTRNTLDGSVLAAITRAGWGFDLTAQVFSTGGYIPTAKDERGLVDTRAGSEHENAVFGMERRLLKNGYKGRVFTRGNVFSERRTNGTALTDNRTYFRQVAAGGELDGPVTGRVELRGSLQTQVYDQTFSAISADRNSETLTRLQRVPSQAAGASLFWTRTFEEHNVTSSVEFRDVRGFSDEVGFAGGVSTSVSGTGGHERTFGFLLQDMWRARRWFIVSVGGRYDRWRNFDARSETRSLTTGAVTRTFFADRTRQAFSPRVAVIVAPNERLSFYGSYSRSFRAPTLNELYRGFRVGNVVTQANENLRSETADTFEGGVSVTHFRNSLVIRGNVFVTTVSDPVVSVTLSSSPALITRRRQNVGETRSRGVEMDAQFSPIAELKLSAGYLFVDSRVTDFPANPSLIGNLLPQVARQQFNVQLTYRPTARWSFGVQSRFASGQFEDEINSLMLRPYATVDATAAFRARKGVELFAAVENVLNSRYDIGLTPTLTTAAPTFARVGLRFDFSKR